ncbi:hypothetical protein ACFV8E_20100 [Streptomyces sp. NPDC059849]|uniref:hypothetical protein n=1 Tax=Streptomyces sp. NPDC059849 TaxID=3346969 RepID=UPI003653B4E3
MRTTSLGTCRVLALALGAVTSLTVPSGTAPTAGNDADIITVVTSDSGGKLADRPFTAAVL